MDNITQYFHVIFDHLTEGVIGISFEGIITLYNKAAQNYLGKDQNNVINHSFFDLFPDNYFGFSMKKALDTKLTQQPTGSLLTVTTQENAPKKLQVSTLLTPFPAGNEQINFAGITIILKVIPEAEFMQSQINQNERLKELGEAASLLAHEIRNPLGGIKGFAQILQRDLKDHPEWQQMASFVVKGADNLNKLVTNVLNFARALKLFLEPTDLVQLLQEIKKSVEVDSNSPKNIVFNIESKQPSFIANIDAKLFRAAFLNMIVNAMQAMPQGGTLTITLDQDDGCIIITIADTGEGIAPDILPKIFAPFFSTKPHGNGFGLTEVKKTIQAHSGTIAVQSEVGKGTTFTLRIPKENTQSKVVCQ